MDQWVQQTIMTHYICVTRLHLLHTYPIFIGRNKEKQTFFLKMEICFYS